MSYLVTNRIAVPVRRTRRTLGMIMAPPNRGGEAGVPIQTRGAGGGPGGVFHVPTPKKPTIPPKPVQQPVRPRVPAAPAPAPKKPSSQPIPVKPVVTTGSTPPTNTQTQTTQTVDPGTVNTLNTDPTALTPQQWSALQSAGLLPTTLPQSDASLLPNASSTQSDDPQCLALGLTGGPYPNCNAAPTAATATVGTPFTLSMIPTWGWVFLGIGVLWYMKKKRR